MYTAWQSLYLYVVKPLSDIYVPADMENIYLPYHTLRSYRGRSSVPQIKLKVPQSVLLGVVWGGEHCTSSTPLCCLPAYIPHACSEGGDPCHQSFMMTSPANCDMRTFVRTYICMNVGCSRLYYMLTIHADHGHDRLICTALGNDKLKPLLQGISGYSLSHQSYQWRMVHDSPISYIYKIEKEPAGAVAGLYKLFYSPGPIFRR